MNATAAGFNWELRDPDPSHLRDEEPGRATIITFSRPGAAGQYVLEVTAQSLKTTAKATAWFSRSTPTMRMYRESVRSNPGAQMPDPVLMSPSAILRFELVRDEPMAMFDVVVADSSVKVALALPGGQVLQQGETGQSDVMWTTRSYSGTPESLAGFALFMQYVMPVQGLHHIIMLTKAAKGSYEIRGSQAGRARELRAALLPMRTFSDPSGSPLPGQARIRRASNNYHCFAGDEMEVRATLPDELGPMPPEFRVRIENTPEGTAVPSPIENVPVTFTRAADGDYHAKVVLSKAGSSRIEVSVKGENASRQSFADQAIFDAHVDPVVARIRSLDAKAVDADGDRKFDRLDLSANLDVVVPGEYFVSFLVVDAKQRSLEANARANLQAGRQSLTARVDGGRIWNELREGPYEVHLDHLFLSSGSRLESVGGIKQVSTLVTTPHAEWDHGPIYGEDRVSIHGILPGPSGRFRLAEVEWDVTTPGGPCSWGGTLIPTDSVRLSAYRASAIPSGKRKVSFFFDAADIAASGAHEWMIDAWAECRGKAGRATLVAQTVDLNPDLYESEHTDLQFYWAKTLVSDRPGSWSAEIDAHTKDRKGAHLALTGVPGELKAKLEEPSMYSIFPTLRVEVAPGAAPGRYFVGVVASAGSETVTRYVAVDIGPLDVPPVRK